MSTPTTSSVAVLGPSWPERATLADSAQAAVAAASVVLLFTDDFDTTARVFDRAEPYLAAHDVMNLTSGTDAHIRGLAARITERGGRFLDGALMGHPEHVGRSETVLVYSGSPDLFHAHRAMLETLGSATFLGSDPGTTTLYETAMLNFAWTTLTGYLYSAALLVTADIPATTTAPLLTHWMSTTIGPVIIDYARQIDDRRYPGDEE
nr:NAD(P)-binding domain-containing protein [Nocardia crassostreae]